MLNWYIIHFSKPLTQDQSSFSYWSTRQIDANITLKNIKEKYLPSFACTQFQQIAAHSDVYGWKVAQAKREAKS